MIVMVTDPISNTMVTNRECHPFIIHGEGRNSTKIYFETQENKEKYLKLNAFSVVNASECENN